MRKTLTLAALLLISTATQAAPFLLADPYPASAPQPDSASFTVNGGAPVACQLVTVAGGVQPKCDLASITAPGTYTLVMTVSRAGGIVNGPNGATNTAAGSASSSPFAYRLLVGNVPTPVLSVAP